MNIQQKFIGTWRLVKVTMTKADQEVFPFGKNPTGYIIYSSASVMAAQIMPENYPDVAEGSDKYVAYFGRYEIDETKQIVNHYVKGSISAARINKILPRHYHFNGNQLSLKPVDDCTGRELIWEKVD